ncbi:MAG: hypothetical protein WKH64_10940 [Chloroflexia bacterium]
MSLNGVLHTSADPAAFSLATNPSDHSPKTDQRCIARPYRRSSRTPGVLRKPSFAGVVWSSLE